MVEIYMGWWKVDFFKCIDFVIFFGLDFENLPVLSPTQFLDYLVVPQPVLFLHMFLHLFLLQYNYIRYSWTIPSKKYSYLINKMLYCPPCWKMFSSKHLGLFCVFAAFCPPRCIRARYPLLSSSCKMFEFLLCGLCEWKLVCCALFLF